MENKKLTEKIEKASATDNAIIHLVETGDISQNPTGSSYKIKGKNFVNSYQNNEGVYKFLTFIGLGALTNEEVVNKLNFTGTFGNFIIEPDQTPIIVSGLKTDGTSLVRHMYLFIGGKGEWGGGVGQTPVTEDKLIKISTFPATIQDVDDASNTQTIVLGELPDGDYITAANSEERDFTDDNEVYFFSYIKDGVEYRVLFNGDPGIYGGEGNPQFDNTNLIPSTNSNVVPTGVQSVNGISVDNTDPTNPVVRVDAVKAEWFGAVADGETDCHQAITAALAYGSNTVIIGEKVEDVYIVSKPVIVPSNKTIVIKGYVKLQDGFVEPLLADTAIGATSVTVTDADTKFFPGQQVVVSDNNRAVQGGGTNQTRRTGSAVIVQSVVGDTITFTAPLDYAYTTAATAKVGHCQTVFLLDTVNRVDFVGTGTIDQNRANQFDIEPILTTSSFEEGKFSCGISVNSSSSVNISGIKVINGNHNIHFKNSSYFNVDKVYCENAHDKNLIMWYCNNFNITNSSFVYSDYEDGIYMHNDCLNGFLSNIYVENCSRQGIGVGKDSKRIVIDGAVAKNCGRAGQFIQAKNITVTGFKSIGGGKDRYWATARPLFVVDNIQDSYLELEVDESVEATHGISVVGAVSNVQIKPTITDLLGSASTGIGLSFGGASGIYPNGVDVIDPILLRNKTGLLVASGSLKIRILGGTIQDNTTNVTNSAGENMRAFGTIGIIENFVNGQLLVEEDGTGASTADIIQTAYFGQPGHKTRRATGSKASPTTLGSAVGLFRAQAAGYNGSAFSSYYAWLSLTTSEAWTPTANGYYLSFRNNKAGTLLPGIPFIYTEAGLSVGESTINSGANYLAKAESGQTNPLFKGKSSSNGEVFIVGVDGSIRVGTAVNSASRMLPTELSVENASASVVNGKITIKYNRITFEKDGKFINIEIPAEAFSSTQQQIYLPSRAGTLINKIKDVLATTDGNIETDRTVKTITDATYTIESADRSKFLVFDNACTVTVPTGLLNNSEYEGMQNGTGQVTFVSAQSGGVDLINMKKKASVNAETAEQYATFKIKILDTDNYLLTGELETV